MSESPKLFPFLIQRIRPFKLHLCGFVFICVYAPVYNVLQPYVVKWLLDSVALDAVEDSFIQPLIKPAAVLIIISLSIALLWRFYNYLVMKTFPKIEADIIAVLTEYLRGHSYRYFQDHHGGAISAKISDLTSNVFNLSNSILNIVRQALTIILSIFVSYLVHPYFALIFFVVSMLFIFMAWYCSSSVKPLAAKYAESRSKASGNVVDCFTNALNMLLFAKEKYEAAYLDSLNKDMIIKNQAVHKRNMINATILSFISWLLLASSVVLLLYLGSKGMISVGDFVLIFMLSSTAIDQIWFLTENLLPIGEIVGVCQQALDTIYTPHEQKRAPMNSLLNVKQGKIEFDAISFSYNKETSLFKEFSLTVEPGMKVGLVGYSGGGKTSLVSLLVRLFDLDGGQILIDGQNISTITRQSLRKQIAYIPQEPTLFHRSILENIGYGDTEASEQDIIEAAKKAFADDFINELPNGYYTQVGERGIKLSGGQRQRIAIARAILKDAPILILDEATSALDSTTEQKIQASLEAAMKNKTVLVIAHRLSTVLAMNKIVVIDKGRILDIGSHQELLKREGLYRDLWDTQRGHSYI